MKLANAEQRGTRVVAIIVRETPDWRDYDFGGLQALPSNGKPLEAWSSPDRFWGEVQSGLRRVIRTYSSSVTISETDEQNNGSEQIVNMNNEEQKPFEGSNHIEKSVPEKRNWLSSLAYFLEILNHNATLLAFFFGFIFIVAMMLLATHHPNPTSFQYTVFRIVLALASAGVAGVIPGMIRLKVEPNTKVLIQAGGALAVFIVVYLQAPAELMPMPPPQKALVGQSAIPPPSSPTLRLSEVDEIEDGVHMIQFKPPFNIRSVRIKNTGDFSLEFEQIGFPNEYFYNTLLDQELNLPAHSERSFHIILMAGGVPDQKDYSFSFTYKDNDKVQLRIRLEGDWYGYLQEQLNQFTKAASASADPQVIYQAARNILVKDKKNLEAGLQEALIGQFLVQAKQPKAAAIAYFKAERVIPKAVKRLVRTPAVMIALAHIHKINSNHVRAADWDDIAAKLGNPEGQDRPSKRPIPEFGTSNSLGIKNSQNQAMTQRSFEPEMIWIQGGHFMMGSPPDEVERSNNERLHAVQVDDFWIGKTEVTFAQYDVFAEATGRDKPGDREWGRGSRPVINISWHDAVAYAAWLSKATGKSYRLPTEAEWEYAARAGTSTRYSWGDALGQNRANCSGCGSQWDYKQTVPVGSFSPNDFGLYDMHGNVWEWTCSGYDRAYDGGEQRCVSSDTGDSRVLRGGSWIFNARYARSAYRFSRDPFNRSIIGYSGFRLARGPKK